MSNTCVKKMMKNSQPLVKNVRKPHFLTHADSHWMNE